MTLGITGATRVRSPCKAATEAISNAEVTTQVTGDKNDG